MPQSHTTHLHTILETVPLPHPTPITCVESMWPGPSAPTTRRTFKHLAVVVADGQRADGHDLRDGAEAEDHWVAQLLHVLDAKGKVPQGIQDLHNAEAGGVRRWSVGFKRWWSG